GPRAHRGCAEAVLPRSADRLQTPEVHRVPQGAAQEQCRQDPAARIARRGKEEGIEERLTASRLHDDTKPCPASTSKHCRGTPAAAIPLRSTSPASRARALDWATPGVWTISASTCWNCNQARGRASATGIPPRTNSCGCSRAKSR